MTGFGKAKEEGKKGIYVVELQSVNRKFLESAVFLPKELSSFEIDIKKAMAKKIFRGQLTFRLNFYPSEENFMQLLPDLKLLKNIKKSWQKIAMELQIKEDEIDLNFIIQQLKGFPRYEKPRDLEGEKKTVLKCLEKAIDELIIMKEKEGNVTLKDIEKRLANIKKSIIKIEKKAPTAASRYEKRLKEKLSEFLTSEFKIDDRILREVAIFADKIDITEEIIRLNSHIEQFYELFKKQDIIGRKMDFLLQEMIREVNTIASKSSDKDVSTDVVTIKSDIEKIREQVQNIE